MEFFAGKLVRLETPLTTYEEAFRAWAMQRIDEEHGKKPHIRRYDLAYFDGCTWAPDVCRHCCFEHDLKYFYSETVDDRRTADAEFRACVAAMGMDDERWWRPVWRLRSWRWWLAVRLFGGRVVSRRRAAWERAR